MNSHLISDRKAIYICPAWSVWSSVINELEEKYFLKPVAVISDNNEFLERSIVNDDCLFISEKSFRNTLQPTRPHVEV